MRRLVVLLPVLAALAVPAAAPAARSCGSVDRPFTDGGAMVTVRKGDLRCSTARAVLRRYWSLEPAAFQQRRRVRHAGIRWTCRPTTDDFPYRWSCTGGGPDRNRYRITAAE
jgi:hypothetical protein